MTRKKILPKNLVSALDDLLRAITHEGDAWFKYNKWISDWVWILFNPVYVLNLPQEGVG